jgi:penicillin-binding protein 1C
MLFLSDPQARLPSFPRMGALEMPFAVAVKTGTSSRFRDAWAVALCRVTWWAPGWGTPTSDP